MKTIAFFNNRDGDSKASLVYHLAWMYALADRNVMAADLDPQAHLTAMFVDDPRLEELWEAGARRTVYGALEPLLEGNGDIGSPHLEYVHPGLDLLAGDLKLAAAEGEMARHWSYCLDRRPHAFRVASSIKRLLARAAAESEAELVLADVGPSLGALSRAALVAADYVVVPLAPDLHSLQGLRNLGTTLHMWREQWAERRRRNPINDLNMPQGTMHPIGYVVMQQAIRLDRPVYAYARWMDRIPDLYARAVGDQATLRDFTVRQDPDCLATLDHFRSLMPMASEARKPVFALKPADGVFGGYVEAVQDSYRAFRALTEAIDHRIGSSEVAE